MDGRVIGEYIAADIDRVIADTQNDGFRKHLGMSVIGEECARSIWYHFRWFHLGRHIGRMLRLFERGKHEEARIVSHLRQIGAVVEDVDPATGKQWLASDFGGHYGGSCDAHIWNLDRYGLPGRGIGEFKTHNDKSFQHLKKHGLVSSKLGHYVQAQSYMGYFGLSWALYVAINKNDDEYYMEAIAFKPELWEQYRKRAWDIINNPEPPPRISNNSSWWVCKLCDFHDHCHHPERVMPARNCRSCLMSVPNTDNGTWYCERWKATIPDDAVKAGCDYWERRA